MALSCLWGSCRALLGRGEAPLGTSGVVVLCDGSRVATLLTFAPHLEESVASDLHCVLVTRREIQNWTTSVQWNAGFLPLQWQAVVLAVLRTGGACSFFHRVP